MSGDPLPPDYFAMLEVALVERDDRRRVERAAPALLSAAEAAYEHMRREGFYSEGEVMTALRAAIDAAKGGAR